MAAIDSDHIFIQNNGGLMYPGTPSSWFRKLIKKHNTAIMNDSTISKEDKEAAAKLQNLFNKNNKNKKQG